MANNIITEENLDKIKYILPNIILMDLKGHLEVEEIVEPAATEEVVESVTSKPTLEDYMNALEGAKIRIEFLSKDDEQYEFIQFFIDGLEIKIEDLTKNSKQ